MHWLGICSVAMVEGPHRQRVLMFSVKRPTPMAARTRTDTICLPVVEAEGLMGRE